MHEDASHSTLAELGTQGFVQFLDLNPHLTPFQRRYVTSIRRCDELERKVSFFVQEIKKERIPIVESHSVDSFLSADSIRENSGAALLNQLEDLLDGHERDLLEANRSISHLSSEFEQRVENQFVLEKARYFFLGEEASLQRLEDEEKKNNQSPRELSTHFLDPFAESQHHEITFSNVTGVINSNTRGKFERNLFRATRGNCYVRFADIEGSEDSHGNGGKTVFVIFYKSEAIHRKIDRICSAFSARLYDIPSLGNVSLIDRELQENMRAIREAKVILNKSGERRAKLLHVLSSQVEEWLWTVRREKSIYHTLSLFREEAGGMFRAEGWVLKEQVDTVMQTVKNCHWQVDSSVPNVVDVERGPWKSTPPTHFATDDYTFAFQEFVDTYGVPRYREANPALFTAATFPFLFGVMYGDIGHSCCVLIAGLFLVFGGQSLARSGSEMMRGLYKARYMISLMGFFGVYMGFIYNDIFSMPLNLFGSSYKWNGDDDNRATGVEANLTSYYGDGSNVYPFGVDPAWHIADNELLFFNSLKMKISVIVGIIQMTCGLFLRGLNAVFFNHMADFWLEFVPMLIFDFALFGYMVIIIFVKWNINWDYRMKVGTCDGGLTYDGRSCTDASSLAYKCSLDYGGTGDGCQPPSLITTLINIALKPGDVDEPMFDGQASLQTVLLLVAFLAVPIILIGKPYMMWKANKEKVERENLTNGQERYRADSTDSASHLIGKDGEEEEEFNMNEIFVHQAIETIEFVLGMISNTASYLRLWALSLAHTELATVFWEKAMVPTIDMNNPVAVVFGFAVFAGATTGVLLLMDVLECFLHALRLHWVEFQNKFYAADGHKFAPFDFKPILERDNIFRSSSD